MLAFSLLVYLAAVCSLGLFRWGGTIVVAEGDKRSSLTKGGSIYESISGGERRNEADGGTPRPTPKCSGTQMQDFTIRSKRGELFMFASLSLVFGFKAPAYHKSQILHDTAEIALSKMQSAKAASSADELLQLRGRQWLVSSAVIGETLTWKTRWNLNRSIFLEVCFAVTHLKFLKGRFLRKSIFFQFSHREISPITVSERRRLRYLLGFEKRVCFLFASPLSFCCQK